VQPWLQMRERRKTNSLTMLRRRQEGVLGGGGGGGWSSAQRCHMSGVHYLPNRPLGVRASMESRAYIGQYSHEGNLFIGETDCLGLGFGGGGGLLL